MLLPEALKKLILPVGDEDHGCKSESSDRSLPILEVTKATLSWRPEEVQSTAGAADTTSAPTKHFELWR